MPFNARSRPGGLAAAARVLFDSAQKSGALPATAKTDEQYALQLKRIQKQSKKKGGSLGQVSYKLADFLAAAQRPEKPQDKPAPPRSTLVDNVPLLHPMVTPAVPTQRAAQPLPEAPPRSKESDRQRAAETPTPEAPSPPKTEQRWADISEIKPLFERTRPDSDEGEPVTTALPRAAVAPSQIDLKTVDSTQDEPAAPAARKERQAVAAPIFVPSPQELREKDSSPLQPPDETVEAVTAADPLSTDTWERQREKELERLRQRQAEAEQERLRLQKVEENRVLGLAWLKERTRGFPQVSVDTQTPTYTLLSETTTVEEQLAAFKKLASSGPAGIAAALSTIAKLTKRIHCLPVEERGSMTERLFSVLDSCKAPEELVLRATMYLGSPEQCLQAYDKLTPSQSEKIRDGVLCGKIIYHLAAAGRWEDAFRALQRVDETSNTSSSKNTYAERCLLRGARVLPRESLDSVLALVEKRLEDTDRMSKEVKMTIAQLSERFKKRAILAQLAASPDADEAVFALLIRSSDEAKLPELLAEMKKRGLDTEDPVVMTAMVFSYIDPEHPMAAFEEIRRQEKKIGLRHDHLSAAIRMCCRVPTDEVFHESLALVKRLPTLDHRLWYTSRLIPLLFEKRMLAEVVQVFKEDLEGNASAVRAYSERLTAFINDALRSAGDPPITESSVKDINYRPVLIASQDAKGGAAVSAAALGRQTISKDDISELTERVLTLAKEKKWEEALSIVQGLPPVEGEKSAALTLVFNCALSASVDNVEALKQTYQLMKERDIPTNSTTVNTVLSSLSKSPLWQEAIDLYDTTTTAQRDTNTYLIYFSLLARQNLGERAIDVYDEMKKTNSKPTVSMFTVAIGATSSHSWSATLRIFNDMLKVHGANVKDSVINQVSRCLEQNNKTEEIAKLEKEVEKKQKKKKKK